MKFRGLIVLAGAAAAIAMVPGAALASGGHTVTSTQHVHGMFYEPGATNPCTGDTLNGGKGALFDGNLVNHVTFFPAGDEVWATFTETGSVTATDDVTGVSYSGHATAWGNDNMNRQNSNTSFTLNVRLAGSDGSVIMAHQNTTFVMNANGTVTVNVNHLRLTGCTAG